ncbi:MAG TPA: bifunctional DNA primase/polymerase [Streptosporangiaceae bacterium]|nr:bifunctional DNA primase/polymerase [Streptosporangiaceae bacterium]
MPATSNAAADLDAARQLARLGVPVFTATLAPDGHPERYGWPALQPGTDETSLWRPGLALCAVMGHGFDVLDVDPRNGGNDSLPLLLAELQGEVPEVHGRVSTPSGGWHLWIAALGIGKRSGFLPGLDLQGATAAGTGRGLVFLPPTVRPSKVTGELRAYAWHTVPQAAATGDTTGAKLARVIEAAKREPTLPPSGQAAPAVKATSLTAPYIRAAVAAELDAVAAACNGSRNDQLNRSAYALARFVADGALDGQAVEDALTSAAGQAGLSECECRRTIRSAFAARGVA